MSPSESQSADPTPRRSQCGARETSGSESALTSLIPQTPDHRQVTNRRRVADDSHTPDRVPLRFRRSDAGSAGHRVPSRIGNGPARTLAPPARGSASPSHRAGKPSRSGGVAAAPPLARATHAPLLPALSGSSPCGEFTPHFPIWPPNPPNPKTTPRFLRPHLPSSLTDH
jgi:hypothetical protein